MEKSFLEILKEGNESRSFRDVIDNLVDGEILGAVYEYAAQFKTKWICVNKGLPQIELGTQSLSVDVLVRLGDGGQVVSYYNYSSEKWELANPNDVVMEWCELPK